MVSRTRTRYQDLINGSITRPGYAPILSSRYNKQETCKDVVGDMFDTNGLIRDHPFDLSVKTYVGFVANGYHAGSSATYTNSTVTPPSGGAPLTFTTSEKESLRVRMLASTGPLTPKVNLPVFIFELKDIPMMLKHAGDLLHKIRTPSGLSPHKEAAAATLAFQFGWQPLISDLRKLINFSDLVKKRQVELEKANSSRGLMRRMTFDTKTDSTTDPNMALFSYASGTVYGPVTTTRTTKAWGTVRWKLKGSQNIGRKPSHNEAFKSALGLNLGQIPINVWKVLPWSWMVDWFADISNVMQANYNMIFYTPSSINFMENQVVEVSTSGGYQSNGLGSYMRIPSGSFKSESKLRSQLSSSSAKVTLRVPFLDTFKLSILGSLAILGLSGQR